jgi:serine/threonine protein kinase
VTGQLFKNYTIDREIGKGGMATIHLAKDMRTGRAVALKFLLPSIEGNEGFVRQFMEEFKANEFLKHQNIVEAIEAGQHEGRWYIAMEYIDGGSLKELVVERGRLPLDLAVHAMINVLKGLQYSHHCGVVHQDMKPANLMLMREGSVKIADFGISKVASPDVWIATGRIRGTPSYMAPEQAAGKEPTYRWDIFSTGVVFYELLAGFNPFGAKDPQVALKKITGENPPPLTRASATIPFDIEVIVARMLEKDPDKRYGNVETILVDLQKVTTKLQLQYSQELFRNWLEDPQRVTHGLAVARSRFHLEQARRLLAQGKPMADLALWEVYVAALENPHDQEPRTLLQEIARQQGFSLQKSNSMALKSLEARLSEHPDDIKSLIQAAKLHRAEANVLQTFFFCRSALSLAPLDAGVREQVAKTLGPGKIEYL